MSVRKNNQVLQFCNELLFLMDFPLWIEVEFAHGCAVAPHQDFEKTFFIICKVLVGLGVCFLLFVCFQTGPILMVHLFLSLSPAQRE